MYIFGEVPRHQHKVRRYIVPSVLLARCDPFTIYTPSNGLSLQHLERESAHQEAYYVNSSSPLY